MKMSSGKKIFTVSAILIGAVWACVISAVAVQFFPFVNILGSLLGGILAIAVSLIYIWVLAGSTGGRAEEVDGISLWAAAAFLLLSLIMNGVLVFLGLGGFNALLLCLNLALFAAFIIGTLLYDRYTSRVSETLSRASRKTCNSAEFSRNISGLLGLTSDPALADRLRKLLEMVEYSSNIAVPAAQTLEEQFCSCLQGIRTSLADPGVSQAEVMDQISQAERLWKQRNAVSAR